MEKITMSRHSTLLSMLLAPLDASISRLRLGHQHHIRLDPVQRCRVPRTSNRTQYSCDTRADAQCALTRLSDRVGGVAAPGRRTVPVLSSAWWRCCCWWLLPVGCARGAVIHQTATTIAASGSG